MKTPEFLRQLMSSPAYMDKNSAAYAMAEKYLNLLYPGTAQPDATGRMTEPPYDMTLAQFNKAQDALEAALEEAKQEAEAEYEEAGQEIDIDAYVELEEAIDVRVLMPLGTIENKQLEVYTLDLPEDDDDTPNNKTRRVWRWHSEDGDNTCDECASRDGEIYDSEEDIPEIPVHPNCRCYITEDTIDDQGNTIKSKMYKRAEAMKNDTDDKNFDMAYEKLAEREGGYTDGSNQIDDEPTNMGITQTTLINYSAKHPESNMPSDVKDLTPEQAREIYKAEYWDNTNIPQINNPRIRNAVFDMSVMSGPIIPTKTVQQTLNDQMNANLPETGYLGKQTITALNAIPNSKINDFMKSLIDNRIQSLQTMSNWPTAQGGWTQRTKSY